MYDKITSMQNILNRGLNIHKFYIPETFDEYMELLVKLEICTIRTDHKSRSQDLPFYIYNTATDGLSKLLQIWKEAESCCFKLIISDGIQYDFYQKYNMVVSIQRDGAFKFEASELKIPLRHMYRHPMLSCSGNIAEEISTWRIYNNRFGIDKRDILKDLQTLYTFEIFNKWLEVTKYPMPVGVKHENIVFWQIS